MRSRNRSPLTLLLPLFLVAPSCVIEGSLGPGNTTGALSSGNGTLTPGSSLDGTDTSPSATPGPAVLFADSNRDGKVDLQGDSDLADRMTSSRDKGALFLANLDDDSSRCKDGATVAMMTCFDASDEVVNGPEDAKDLALIKTRPMQVSDAATAKLQVSKGPTAQIRIFEKLADGSYQVITPDTNFDAKKLRQGLIFVIEGKDIARDKKTWDGSIHLKLVWEDQGQRLADELAMRVAPLVTHSHVDFVEQLISSPTQDPQNAAFRRDLEQGLTQAQQPAPLYLDPKPTDLWAQDYFEPCFASMPGPNGPVSMRVLLRSNQQRKESHLQLLTLLGPNVGVTGVSLKADPDETGVQRGGTYDAFGNLETIPPIPGFPAGRQIVGGSMNREMGPSQATMALLEAQGVQDPIWLDSAWLAVGHVDEFISFVPSSNAKLGFKVLVADPVGTLNLLKKAMQDGHGKVPMLSYAAQTPDEKKALEEAGFTNPSIEAFLAKKDTEQNQANAEKHIKANLDILRKSIGLTEEDIVRIPSLYAIPSLGGVGDLGLSGSASQYRASLSKAQQQWAYGPVQRQLGEDQLGGFYPAAANMVVLPKHKNLLIAKQYGPVINGVDIIEQELTKVVSSIGYTPRYVDDFLSYHLGEGDVHCGTNTLRSIKDQWWTP